MCGCAGVHAGVLVLGCSGALPPPAPVLGLVLDLVLVILRLLRAEYSRMTTKVAASSQARTGHKVRVYCDLPSTFKCSGLEAILPLLEAQNYVK